MIFKVYIGSLIKEFETGPESSLEYLDSVRFMKDWINDIVDIYGMKNIGMILKIELLYESSHGSGFDTLIETRIDEYLDDKLRILSDLSL